MTTVLCVFILTLLVITAFGVIQARNLFSAVMLGGIYSFEMASIFFILDAADVALTEAAIGAGITTVFFLGALALTEHRERGRHGPQWLPIGVMTATGMMLIYASFDNPRIGDPNAPVHVHVAPWYLEQTPQLIDIQNIVSAILASFRGYDTLGELFVIFTAGIGVLFILSAPAPQDRKVSERLMNAEGLRHHLVPRVVGQLLVPFIVLFGLYVQFHGDYGPGGGFQAGALISAGLILYALLRGEIAALRAVPMWFLRMLIVSGALLYTTVGIAGMLLGGSFLDYSVLSNDPVAGQHLGILLVEVGVGLTVTGVLLSIFHAFAARGQ
ncbi:MAG TPA: DUF4040 domain-containing protein [Woeseiaceae bacterium]|nr:DUF4040 domain-containing protein [Woeseiaceae bacterium]